MSISLVLTLDIAGRGANWLPR